MPELLSGRLPPFQLSTILQMAESDGITGYLAVDGGRIGFLDGAVVSAEHGGFHGRVALTGLLMDAAGAFSLSDDAAPAAGSESLGGSAWIVMEAAQLSDEWARLASLIVAGPWAPAEGGLQRLAAELDGDRTLSEARQLAGLPVVVVLEAVEAALASGDLAAVKPPDRKRAQQRLEPRTVSFFELLDEGRQHLRARRYPAAEFSFSRALAMRPGDRMAQQNLRRARALREKFNP